ncbi:tRNA/RNA methyltransferase SpoU [Formosa agariphila KMM 3901]|uniref:tRNA/RNA methyltransferase SpoU n=1 Tax=Formosa agariphila (strain DSM 15362 / KCTC 12365 / LMG 23005 / KMM 3901 / M-2Alg 35-1) TaxID=1347342 RepID=T2KH70_FORAG|nr:RNA methyltransferase [Formosa agariphila]CDF78192.1 tRNA/RNA methyltransferase SpoU [Formosa agariphila KMM 3901]
MLSKNQIKLINKLKLKKHRVESNLFVAEGIKTIKELLQSDLKLQHVYATEPFNLESTKETLISETDLKRVSFLTTPNQALAVFEIPKSKPIDLSQLCVALDDVRDPGNLGTIIRLCDWFGIHNLICNKGTVDCFNPKVVQATMGSITRVNINYLDLESFLKEIDVPIYGAFMEGENVYTHKNLSETGVLVMGNEANGVSKTIEALITEKIAIPRFGELKETESLNVATATSILLSEFKRRSIEM